MKKSNSVSTLIAATALLVCAAASHAQDQVNHVRADDGTPVIVTSGQPTPEHYGPPPSFAQLDVDHNGTVSREEAHAYIPLFNDFDNLAHHTDQISKQQYATWSATQK